MKKVSLFATGLAALLFSCTFVFSSCDGISKKQTVSEQKSESETPKAIDYMNVKDKSFNELFMRIEPADFRKTLSALAVENDNTVITAGTASKFNSMAASWEALGQYYQKPMVFSMLGAERYTLEFIKERQNYTLTFLPEQFQGDLFAFGAKSGRDSDKMEETKLTNVETPSGNITYKEAKVVIECRLFEITSVNPNDFYDVEAKNFVEEANTKNGHGYYRLVFGRVTDMWVRK